MQQEHHFETQIKHELNYLLFLPKDYAVDVSHPWPLILFLHGMGERGDNLELVKLHGIARIVDEQPDFPFIAVSPQCPIHSIWPLQLDTLKILLEDVMGKYAVDENRVYLTGLSMGGYGSWAMGAIYPEMFAAVAPICGGGSVSAVCALKDTPVWAFHGDSDPVVPLYESQHLVDALKACGGDVRLTVYPGVGHDSWTQTYNNPELYDWFLSHRRS